MWCRSVCLTGGDPLSAATELEAVERRSRQRTVFLGQPAWLECGVRGRPAPSVSWLRDDQPLVLDPSRMTVLPSGALEVDHVLINDQAHYVCRAENEHGFVLGPRTRLTINTNYGERAVQCAGQCQQLIPPPVPGRTTALSPQHCVGSIVFFPACTPLSSIRQ